MTSAEPPGQLVARSVWRRFDDAVRGAVSVVLGAALLLGALVLGADRLALAGTLALGGVAVLALGLGALRSPHRGPRWSAVPAGVRFEGSRGGLGLWLGCVASFAFFGALLAVNVSWLRDQGEVPVGHVVGLAVIALVAVLSLLPLVVRRSPAAFVVTPSGIDLLGRAPGLLAWDRITDLRHEEVYVRAGHGRHLDTWAVEVRPGDLSGPADHHVHRQHLADLGADPERVLGVLRRLHAEPELRGQLGRPEGVELFTATDR